MKRALRPREFETGLRLYWRGYYWHSHEIWEDVWRNQEEPLRSFMKALIQIDAALIHAQRGEWKGVRNLLIRVRRYLDRCPENVWGISVPRLARQVEAFQREVERVRAAPNRRFRWRVKPRIYPADMEAPKRERLRRAPGDLPPARRVTA